MRKTELGDNVENVNRVLLFFSFKTIIQVSTENVSGNIFGNVSKNVEPYY